MRIYLITTTLIVLYAAFNTGVAMSDDTVISGLIHPSDLDELVSSHQGSDLLATSLQAMTSLASVYLSIADPELRYVTKAPELAIEELIVHGLVIDTICHQSARRCEDKHFQIINLTRWLILADGQDELNQAVYEILKLAL